VCHHDIGRGEYKELGSKSLIKQYVTIYIGEGQCKYERVYSGTGRDTVTCRYSMEYCRDLYLVPLQDQILIDIEFLYRSKTRFYLEKGVMTLDRNTVPMIFGQRKAYWRLKLLLPSLSKFL
jgi:hypothetical protein